MGRIKHTTTTTTTQGCDGDTKKELSLFAARRRKRFDCFVFVAFFYVFFVMREE